MVTHCTSPLGPCWDLSLAIRLEEGQVVGWVLRRIGIALHDKCLWGRPLSFPQVMQVEVERPKSLWVGMPLPLGMGRQLFWGGGGYFCWRWIDLFH